MSRVDFGHDRLINHSCSRVGKWQMQVMISNATHIIMPFICKLHSSGIAKDFEDVLKGCETGTEQW